MRNTYAHLKEGQMLISRISILGPCHKSLENAYHFKGMSNRFWDIYIKTLSTRVMKIIASQFYLSTKVTIFIKTINSEAASFQISKAQNINFDNDKAYMILIQNIVSVTSHCESHALSENSARYDVALYVTMF